jgi:hypothetical protein
MNQPKFYHVILFRGRSIERRRGFGSGSLTVPVDIGTYLSAEEAYASVPAKRVCGMSF